MSEEIDLAVKAFGTAIEKEIQKNVAEWFEDSVYEDAESGICDDPLQIALTFLFPSSFSDDGAAEEKIYLKFDLYKLVKQNIDAMEDDENGRDILLRWSKELHSLADKFAKGPKKKTGQRRTQG